MALPFRVAWLAPVLATGAHAQPPAPPIVPPQAEATEPPPPIIWLAPPPGPDGQPAILVPAPPVATLLIPPPPTPNAAALPPAARAVLEQAMKTGDTATFNAVEKATREEYPDGGGQIDALAAQYAAQQAEKAAADARAKADALAAASLLDNWKGEVDLGGSYSKGNSDAVAVYGAFKLNKNGLRWRHSLSARADYAKSSGTVSTDKDTAAYQPQYKINERLYAYGLGQFDRDMILGFHYRFTEGAGLGYTVLAGSKLHLDVDVGPALRETRYVEQSADTKVAARGSINFKWQPNPALQFANQTAIFFEADDTNISSTTSLDTKLFGPLKGRLSYNLTYENDVPSQARTFDTITAASLVYSF